MDNEADVSISSATSSPKKGFFKKMKLRRRKSEKKSPTRDSEKVGLDQSTLATRRVIKATRPPSPVDGGNPIDDDTIDTSISSGVDRVNNIPLPSVQIENLREKTEQWRQERLDTTAAIRKENKEREVMQHRLKIIPSGDEDGHVFNSKSEEIAAEDVPEIFKIKTTYPENKRKSDAGDHDVEKKSKMDDGAGESNELDEVEKEESSCESLKSKHQSSWMRTLTPMVIAAVGAIIAMRFMRKR